MVAFAAIQAFYTLLRLSGTLQKHVFEPLVTKDLRKALKKARPHADANQRTMIDAVTWSWDTAVGWAYDDPVELIADLGAMGVKLSLLRAGVALPPRLGLTVGTKAAVVSVETFMRGIMGLVGGDPKTGAQDIARSLDGFVGDLIPDAVTPELIEDGTRVALDIAEFAGEAGEFVSKASSGDIFGSLLSGVDLAKKGFDVVTSFLGFVNQAQKALPEPPPAGRTITDAELRRFQEARREKPVSQPKAAPPPPPPLPPPLPPGPSGVLGDWPEFDEREWIRILRAEADRIDSPEALKVSLMQHGNLLTGGSLRALKDRRTATTFPFG